MIPVRQLRLVPDTDFGPERTFPRFWAVYPRRVNRAAALKAWCKLNPSEELIAVILAALAWQRGTWDDPKYTPHASTWLNNERWTDEKPQPATPKAATNLRPVSDAVLQQQDANRRIGELIRSGQSREAAAQIVGREMGWIK